MSARNPKRSLPASDDRNRRPPPRTEKAPRARDGSLSRGRPNNFRDANKVRNRPISPRRTRRRSPDRTRKSPVTNRPRDRLWISPPRREPRKSPNRFADRYRNDSFSTQNSSFELQPREIDLSGAAYRDVQTRFSPPDRVPNDPSDLYYRGDGASFRDGEPQLIMNEDRWKTDDGRVEEKKVFPEDDLRNSLIMEKDLHLFEGPPANTYQVIPDFDPDKSKLTARQWVLLVQEISERNNWTPDERKYHMCQKLAGSARQWYLAANRVEDPWVVVKSQFLDAFPSDMDFHRLLQNMMNRTKKHGESYATYLNQKNILLSKCGITGRKAVSCVLGGITDTTIRGHAFKENFSDIDSLYEYLRGIEKEKEEKKQNKVRNKISKKESSERQPVMFGALGKAATFEKFYMDVGIKNHLFKGYVDFNSEFVTIREDTAVAADLPITTSFQSVNGYMGASISTVGQTYATVTVDRAMANVLMYVVPNYTQAIPIIVGQNFLKQPHIVVMQDEHTVRIYQRMDNGELNIELNEPTPSRFMY